LIWSTFGFDADGSAGSRDRSRRIGGLLCGLVAAAALMAGIAAAALAQNPGTGAPPPNPPGRVTNPNLHPACGIRIMLVLDESSSMTATDLTLTRNAATAFVNGLRGTGTRLAIDAFALRARNLAPYNPVTFANAQSAFISHLAAAGNGFGNPNVAGRAGTNWQDAFRLVQAEDQANAANLVVFVTDGNPNTYQTPPLTAPGGPVPVRQVAANESTTGWNAATGPSMSAANDVKGQDSRILVLGLGASLFGPTIPVLQRNQSIDRLRWISGDTEFGTGPSQNPNLTHASYLVSESFAQLQTALTTLTAELCGSRLEITKRIQDHQGELAPAAGWRFSTTLTPTGSPPVGTHTWLSPGTATNGMAGGPTAEALTTTPSEANPLGAALFQWTIDNAAHRVTVSHTHETARPGYHFVQATCRDVGPNGPIPGSEVNNPPGTTVIPGATLGEGDFRTCDVINRTSLAKLTVVKRCEPPDDPGEFNLHIGPDVTSALNVPCGEGTLPQTLPLGTYTVSETAGANTTLDHYRHSIECVDLADNNRVVVRETPGPGPIPVHLTRDGENVECTITNVSTQFGELTVIKHLIPPAPHDSGTFNLLVNGTAYAHGVTDGGRIDPPLRRRFGTYHVTETGAHGTDLGQYQISTICFDQNGTEVGHNPSGPEVAVHLNEDHNQIECTITNERPGIPVARLTVVKHLAPHNDAGIFDLVVGGRTFAVSVGHNGTTGPLEFELGPHTVTEHAAGRTNLNDFSISTTCVDRALGGRQVAHNAHGPAVTVDLSSASDDIVCTITNTRTLEPGGGGEQPPPPGTAPHLAVVKRMPPQAQVRELVPITITVHNLGRGTANGVQLRENPPSGMRIVHVANGGTIQHGVAVWHLGNLAHGASRTVHATAQVLNPGKHVDIAVATALNADPALSMAALRARVHRQPPRFTG
jgi:hypothetical protein